jgi:hypothetical protein
MVVLGLGAVLAGGFLLLVGRSPRLARSLGNRGTLVVLLIVVLSMMTSANHAVAGDPDLTVGFSRIQTTPYTTAGGRSACAITFEAWAWEHGENGITRLKGRFYLKGANDTTEYLPSYGNTTYTFSPYFPNDANNYAYYFSARFNVPAGGLWRIQFKGVGERSFPRPDRKKSVFSDQVGCEGGGFSVRA